MDGRDRMFIDNLCATSPNKPHREVVELPDLAHLLDSVHKKHRHIDVVVAEMFQEGVLKD